MISFQLGLSAQTTSLLFGVLLPILVALVTKEVASPRVKALLLSLLAAVAGVAAQVIGEDGSAVFTEDTLWAIATSWVIAVATYYGLWKPTGAAGAIQHKTQSFGLGRSA